MFVECPICGRRFVNTLSHDELGWYSYCDDCDTSFDVDVPDGRYRVLISGNNGGKYEEYRAYEDYISMCVDISNLLDWYEGCWIWVYDRDCEVLSRVFDCSCADFVRIYYDGGI